MSRARRQQKKRARRWALESPTGRAPSKPELQRLSPRTALGIAVHEMIERTFRLGQPDVAVDYSAIEARIAARL